MTLGGPVEGRVRRVAGGTDWQRGREGISSHHSSIWYVLKGPCSAAGVMTMSSNTGLNSNGDSSNLKYQLRD
jgi:hypothetical protein